jgi:type I restriction enzyme M protein
MTLSVLCTGDTEKHGRPTACRSPLSWLWESANIPCGSIDSSDFKNYIFRLLFLKRFNDVLKERAQQLQEVDDLSRLDALAEVQAKRGALPPDVRWPSLIVCTENIGEALHKAFAII